MPRELLRGPRKDFSTGIGPRSYPTLALGLANQSNRYRW
jgi:hypothetical protein